MDEIRIVVLADDQASGPLNQIATGALRSVGAAVVSMAGDAVQALAGFASASVTSAGNFQQSMSVLQAASGASAGQMQQLSSLAVALGNDMALPGASAQDAATAMLELSKAGLTVNDTMAAAKGTLQLAAAAETDAATAAGIVAGALNAFHLEGAQAAVVADQLAAGANASAASITDLSGGFQQAGFVFNATGQHTDDLISALSMLTNVGLTGSDAGTALKNAMMQLMAPTSQAAGVMQQYGINVRDAQGNMLPFRDIIGVLQTQLGGLSAAQREAALKTILQGDGMKAMLPLLQAGVTGFDAMKAKVGEAGAAQSMAAAQMTGFNGAMGGLSNAVETLQLVIGTALLPGLTALVGIASGAINTITTFAQALFGSADAFQQLGPVAQFAVNALQMVGEIFTSLGSEAAAWGANIVNQLAGGMADAAGAVIGVLMELGGMITEWLVPHSPPKLLPNLDQWGADAATVYMEGWSKADFGVFTSIGDTIKGALEGIAKATGNKGLNVASMVLGAQDDVAKAINEIHSLGSVSEETFQAIIAAAGPAGPQIGGLVRAYLDLEKATQDVSFAQDALNSVTAEYTAKLDPLNAQLKGIQNQKQAIQDQQRLAKLYEEVGNSATDAASRQLAMLEIQEIQTRQSIRATEADRDSAVGAAKSKLDAAKQQQAAAQAQVDQQKALSDAQNKTNALIAEQSKAIAGAAGAMKGAAAAVSAHAMAQAGSTSPIAAVTNALDTAQTAYTNTTGAATTAAQTVASTVSPAFQALQAAVAPIGAFISANMGAITGALSGIGVALAGLFAVLVVGPAIWAALGAAVSAVGVVIGAILSPIGLLLIASATIGAAISTNFMGLGTVVSGLLPILSQLGTVISQTAAAFSSGGLGAALTTLSTGLASIGAQLMTWGAQLGPVLLAIGQAIAAQVLAWGTAFISWISPYIPIVLGYLAGFAASVWGWIAAQAPILLAQIGTWGLAFAGWISPYIPIALGYLATFAASVWGWIAAQAPILLAQIGTWGLAFAGWISPAIPIALGYLAGFAASVWGWITAQAPALLGMVMGWGQALVGWIAPAIPPALAALGGLASSVFGWVGQQAAPLVASFVAWATALVEWIPGATVTFLAAWPGMLSSFLDWIASAAGPLLAQLATWAAQFVAWIVPMIPGFVLALGGILLALGTFIVSSAAVIVSKIVVWAASMLGWVASNVLPALPGILGSILSSIVSWIAGPANAGILSSALGIGKALVDGIRSGIEGAWGRLMGWISAQVAKIPEPIRAALGIHSPSQVMAKLVGAPTAEGIGAGFVAAMPKVTANLVNGVAGLMDKIAGAVDKGAQALNAVSSFKGSSGTGLAGFLAGIKDLAIQFNDLAVSLGGRILGTATRFAETVGKVTGVLETGVKGLNALADLAAPSRESVAQFGNSVALIVGNLATVASWFDAKAIKAAAVFAEAAGKILAVVGPAIDALKKLPDLVVPSREAVGQFGGALALVVGNIATIASWFDAKAVAAAAVFAESVGKIVALIGPAVDAFAKLPDIVAPTGEAVTMLGMGLVAVVSGLSYAASLINVDGLAAVVAFAEGAGKIVAVIKPAVDGFRALPDLVAPTVDSAKGFADALLLFIGMLWFAVHQLDTKAVEASAVFAESAGKIVGMIKPAIDGFAALPGLVAPSVESAKGFADALLLFIGMLWFAVHQLDTDGVAAMAVFAESAGKILGIIKTGVDGFAALSDLAPVSERVIGMFVDLVNTLLIGLAAAAAGFSTEAIAAAGQFADAAGKAVGILSDGVEGLLSLSTFTGVSEAAVNRFADGVRLAVAAMARLAAEFGVEAVASAKAFAQAAGESTDFLKKGVDGFKKLTELTEVPKAGLAVFEQAVLALIASVIRLSTLISTQTLADATRLANATDQVITVVKDAIKAFMTLGVAADQLPAFVQSFVSAVTGLASRFGQAVIPPAADVGAQIILAIGTGGAAAIPQAIASLQGMGAALVATLIALNAALVPISLSIGANIAIGIANGITSQTAAIQNAIVAALQAGILAAEQTLGIASPSKVFATMGVQSGAGYVGGAETMQPAVAAAGQGLAQAASQGAADLMPQTRSASPAPASSSRSVTLTVAPGAIVIHAAAGQSEQAIADAGLARLQQLARQAAVS